MTIGKIVDSFVEEPGVARAARFFESRFGAFRDPSDDFVEPVADDRFFVRLAFRAKKTNGPSFYFPIIGFVSFDCGEPRVAFFFAPDEPLADDEAPFDGSADMDVILGFVRAFFRKSA